MIKVKEIEIEPKHMERLRPKLYNHVERELLQKFCKPAKLLGFEFDRMIYQNYDKIKKMNFK